MVRLAVQRGHQVVNLDALTYPACLENVAPVANSPLYAFEQVDIRDRSALDRVFASHKPDAVMHLAAESHVDRSIDGPGAFIETNITGTYNMLEAARHYWEAEGKPDTFRFHHISTDEVPYHAELKAAASDEVIFPGAIYEHPKVQALRKHARFYIHGHRVGGTNPSLVEALGAGNAILAMNNDFNAWVAGKGATYFNTVEDCAESITKLFADGDLASTLRAGAEAQFEAFTWPAILAQYEALLLAEHTTAKPT